MIPAEKILFWFENHLKNFEKEGKLAAALRMKEKHSRRVSGNCLLLADMMCWKSRGETRLAASAGLLHDIGRFPQYEKYHTFLDSASVDHGDLGAEIMTKSFDWRLIGEAERGPLLAAVRFHNKKDMPALHGETFRWAALARDADKIDIFRVVQEKLERGSIFDMPLELGQALGLSPDLLEEVELTGKGSYSKVRSFQDYRLIQLTWGCDINYPCAADILRRENIFQKICRDLAPYKIDPLIGRLTSAVC